MYIYVYTRVYIYTHTHSIIQYLHRSIDRHRNALSFKHGINLVTKSHFPMRYIPLRFQPTASAAGTKPQKRGKSLLSKTPLRDCVLDDTVKKKRPLRGYQSLFAATTHFPLQLPLVTSFLFFPFNNPLPIFSFPSCHSFNQHPLTPTSFAPAEARMDEHCSLLPGGEMRHVDTHCGTQATGECVRRL